MLLTRKAFQATLSPASFKDVTDTALNPDSEALDAYVEGNLDETLGRMQISHIYDAKDQTYRHILFDTEIPNLHYVVVLELKTGIIVGHHVLDLNREYGI